MASTRAEEVTLSLTHTWLLLLARFATKIPGSNLKELNCRDHVLMYASYVCAATEKVNVLHGCTCTVRM